LQEDGDKSLRMTACPSLGRDKMYKGRSLRVAIAMSCLPVASAIAQQASDLVGEWNGKLENWTIGTHLRKLIVAPDGSCRVGFSRYEGRPRSGEVVFLEPGCGNH